ncbi:hypothetical protein [Bacillus salipaludis]|uniref:Uncharacterized protein n=1 Tax=Bacillus salipaludis TaxID=2547811 RepID=A0AA90TXB3_9BACI|nr:hypothetical protein [Bacillus salipaludis]MDQ6601034.1 hypothetical protein [Bacillus salipaludis]
MKLCVHALHAINQGMRGFNKTIASFTLYSINQLMSFNLISTIASEAGSKDQNEGRQLEAIKNLESTNVIFLYYGIQTERAQQNFGVSGFR